MALNAAIVWEVRTTGADTNGGGFKTGATGTDHTQQNAAQYAVTDAVTNGTTTITSATANFGTDVVGNVLYIQGGSATITAGWYEITVRTNSTTITVDRSTGLTSGTGATLNIGGAFATIGRTTALYVAGNTIYIKATATYSISASIAFSTAGASATPIKITGYGTVRGDTGRATVQASSGVSNAMIDLTGGFIHLRNVICDVNAQSSSTGIRSTAAGNWIHNCKVTNSTSSGILVTAQINMVISECWVDVPSGTGGILATYGQLVRDCMVTGGSCPAFKSVNQAVFVRCIASGNSGATSHGFQASTGMSLVNCVAYNNGGSGAKYDSGYVIGSVQNSLFISNGVYGIDTTTAPGSFNSHYNGFYNNTSGTHNGLPVEPTAIILTGDPFTNAAGGDFSLNTTAGAGAAARATGFPGVLVNGLTTGYLDLGAAQHQDPVSGGGKGGDLRFMIGGVAG